MKRAITKSIGMGIAILLFCMSDLHAQYIVFEVKGIAEMSVDGQTWMPLKKKAELKESYQLRLHDNSLVSIIDSKNLIYSYALPKTVSVGDIVKKRKSILAAINEKSEKRKAIGGVERSYKNKSAKHDICLSFTDTETLNIYDNLDLIPEGAVFYITIFNKTKDDQMVNVNQELENGESIPCFLEDIWIGKNSLIEIKELLFGKQGNNKFVVIPKSS